MPWYRVFLVVTGCSMVEMVSGGLFGFAAGSITPNFFSNIIPWQDVEPIGVAVFFGATAGIILGGVLGCFGLLVQLVFAWRHTSTKDHPCNDVAGPNKP